VFDHCLIGNRDGLGNLDAGGNLYGTAANPLDPGLGSLSNNGGPTKTCRLRNSSPAIKKGTSLSGLSCDQCGTARKSTPDIGAYETPDNPVIGILDSNGLPSIGPQNNP
jgi:hypothetical protein